MIKAFGKQYAFLSNFYQVSVNFEGTIYPTVEHAYQASKSFDDTYRKRISFIPGNKAGLAKIRGQNVKLRPDWEKVKVNIMKKLLYKKFMYPHLRNLLLQTQNEDLEEGNYHNDNFWGNCRCKKCKDIPGQNMLGKLLMEIRKELREDKT
jgi:ribA/ribD-fused uncharacterized protein